MTYEFSGRDSSSDDKYWTVILKTHQGSVHAQILCSDLEISAPEIYNETILRSTVQTR